MYLSLKGLSKRPMGPQNRKSSLPKHQEVKKRFLEICDTTFSEEVRNALRLPAFDSYEWSDADIIHLMQTMFIELGFIDKFNIPVDTLREWLYEVYKHYNEVPFHNFRHCFCVAQMVSRSSAYGLQDSLATTNTIPLLQKKTPNQSIFCLSPGIVVSSIMLKGWEHRKK